MKKFIYFLLIVLVSAFTLYAGQTPKVKTGADLLFTKYFHLIKGKNVGLVTNHTGILSNGMHIADALFENKQVHLVALFGPEHGVRGDTTGPVGNSIDKKTGVTAYSLYGKTYKPTPEMMKGIDVMIFDIQDVGARFYTFISTLGFTMEAAAEKGIPFIVLDRPDPIGGFYVDGPVAEDSMRSFVAYAPIPTAYGMTTGELAEMYNGEGWLHNGKKCNLIVAKMDGWNRHMWYDQTGLKWIKPSPNMPTLATATVYTGTCIFEGTNVSEGRGTDKPFEYIGAPWLNAEKIAAELNELKLKGVKFESLDLTPTMRPNNAYAPKYNNQKCSDVYVKVTDRNTFEPVRAGLYLLWAIRKDDPGKFKFKDKTFDRLCGTPEVREMLEQGKTPEEIFASWEPALSHFKKLRANYLLYK